MKFLLALVAVLSGAATAVAAPDGVPARVYSLGNWRVHDPEQPSQGAAPWTPADALGFLALHPDAFLDLGYRDAYPPGNASWFEKGRQVRELRADAAAKGIDVGNRLCMSYRFDVHDRFSDAYAGCQTALGHGGCDWEGDMDGSLGEREAVLKYAGTVSAGNATILQDAAAEWSTGRWNHRLLVLRPGSASEEQRRITATGADAVSVDHAFDVSPQPGDGYEIRGSFDPAWVLRVPRAVHEEAVRRDWAERRLVCGPDPHCQGPAEPLDPLDPGNHRAWPEWVDREAIAGLANASSVPALYGRVPDAGRNPRYWEDPYFEYTAVVMDLRNAAYRDWSIRYLMYKLQDYGFQPGKPACILVAYKPGWYTWYDEAGLGPSRDICAVPGSQLWTGPAHVCRDGWAPGGPFDSGTYGRGEYENAVNAWFRQMFQTLAAKGYGDLRVITTERPRFLERRWTILADDVRSNPHLEGEWEGSIEPSLAELRGAPPAPNPTPGDDPLPLPDDVPGGSGSGTGSSPAGGRSADRGQPAAGGHVERASGSGGGAAAIEPPVEGQN